MACSMYVHRQSLTTRRFRMTAQTHIIVVTLLCGLSCIGRVPAWLHVAEGGHGSRTAVATQASELLGGCCHCRSGKDNAGGVERASLTSGRRNSDGGECPNSCVLWQALSALNGVAWQQESLSAEDRCPGVARIAFPISLESTPILIPHSRDPPLLFA